jgi:plasmid stabilization system protein ParE
VLDIAAFTADRWGKAQAERYVTGLYSGFQTIVDRPELRRPFPEIPPYFRALVGKHAVFYRLTTDGEVLIVSRLAHDDAARTPPARRPRPLARPLSGQSHDHPTLVLTNANAEPAFANSAFSFLLRGPATRLSCPAIASNCRRVGAVRASDRDWVAVVNRRRANDLVRRVTGNLLALSVLWCGRAFGATCMTHGR